VPQPRLTAFVPGQLWLRDYPIRYMGTRFNARMTVIRLAGGAVVIHSPSPFDPGLAAEVSAIGPVRAIIAPGDFHYLNVTSCKEQFPEARTYICPGVDEKMPELAFDEMLGDEPPSLWADELSQVLVTGTKRIREVLFFHRPSKTLIVVDLVENFSNQTPGTNWMLRAWFTLFRQWNRAAPAPEYRTGWGDRATVRACLERALAWDFERVVLAHGDLIVDDARAVVEHAWRGILAH
jgi:hypothetical protein